MGAWAGERGGRDRLGVAGGMGENAREVRARICEGRGFLGIELDSARNAATEPVISADGSGACVRVIRTDEELMIAKAVIVLLGTSL